MSSSIAGERKAGYLQAAALLFPITMAVMASVALQPDQIALISHFSNVANSLVLQVMNPQAGVAVPEDIKQKVLSTEILIGVMTTVPAIAATIFAVVSGYLADLFGRRRVLLVAVFVYIFVGSGPYFLNSFAAVFACRIGVGLCEAVVLTVTTAMLGDYFKGSVRDRMMGFQTTIASVSASIMIPVAGILASKIGWNGPFLIYLVAAVWFLGVLLFTWEPAPDAGETFGSASWAGFPWTRMIEICVITVLGSYLFYTVQFEVTKFMPKFGVIDPAAQGADAGLMSWGMAGGSFLYMFFVNKKVGHLLLAELTLAAAAYFGMANATSEHMLVLFGFLNQVGCGAVLPTLLVASMRFLPFEHRGRGTGIWQGTFASGQFVVGVTFPLLKDALGGDYSKGFEVVGSVTAAAAVIALIMAIRSHGKIAQEA